MGDRNLRKRITAAGIVGLMWLMPLAAMAQTRIVPPRNKYSVQDDIKLGNQAAREVEQQFPIINDPDATAYIERVGQRLVAAVPAELRQPAFSYRFQWVNASDINAFALPGGPMYINRGMIAAANNEGEMAGVMAHELSHVVLRHATAQATKQSSAKSTLGQLGLILGGAILGGNAGAQLGGALAQGWMLKYSREYESQADMLGARIMANAGYDPRDLANVFRTIQQQERGSGPEWLSSHPDPGNRYQAINREVQYLPVSANPIKLTRDFERIKARFAGLPRARTMAEIEQGRPQGNNGGRGQDQSYGRYSDRVQGPSGSYRTYSSGVFSMQIPTNWQEMSGSDSIQFAPAGAYGDQGITRGVMVGVYRGSGDIQSASQQYVEQVLQGNSYLRPQGRFTQSYLAGRRGYSITASGRSPLTGQTEVVTINTAQLDNNGNLFYAITVVPQDESYAYNNAFRNVLNSIRISN